MNELHNFCNHYGLCVCSPKKPTYQELESKLSSCEARVERYRKAFEEIRDQAWEENALDPQWASRIAKQALSEGLADVRKENGK